MCHISGPSDKSLLLQTVALFETLLSKINELKNENTKLKTDQHDFYNSKVSSLEDIQKIHADRDQLVLELEESRNKLNQANQVEILTEQIIWVFVLSINMIIPSIIFNVSNVLRLCVFV